MKHDNNDRQGATQDNFVEVDILQRRLDEWYVLARSSAPDVGELYLWAADAAEAMQHVVNVFTKER